VALSGLTGKKTELIFGHFHYIGHGLGCDHRGIEPEILIKYMKIKSLEVNIPPPAGRVLAGIEFALI